MKHVSDCWGKKMAETVGSLVDKISILELKIFHMGEQLSRTDAAPGHIDNCKQKVAVMKIQLTDLLQELDELMEDLSNGKKKLKIYRQFKMYNDPKYTVPSSGPENRDLHENRDDPPKADRSKR